MKLHDISILPALGVCTNLQTLSGSRWEQKLKGARDWVHFGALWQHSDVTSFLAQVKWLPQTFPRVQSPIQTMKFARLGTVNTCTYESMLQCSIFKYSKHSQNLFVLHGQHCNFCKATKKLENILVTDLRKTYHYFLKDLTSIKELH